MFNRKEIAWIIIVALIFGFLIAFSYESESESESEALIFNDSLIVFLISFLIILTSVFIKKLAVKYFSVDIQFQIWKFKRYGWYTRSHFKKPIPIGLILPFFLTIMSLGIIKPFTFLQFKSKPAITRILKKRGAHRREEVNESDIAFISAWGLWGLIVLAIIGSLINFPDLTKYAIYFGIWNLLPISNLDGAKLFFGSLFNWILLVIAYIIALLVIII